MPHRPHSPLLLGGGKYLALVLFPYHLVVSPQTLKGEILIRYFVACWRCPSCQEWGDSLWKAPLKAELAVQGRRSGWMTFERGLGRGADWEEGIIANL